MSSVLLSTADMLASELKNLINNGSCGTEIVLWKETSLANFCQPHPAERGDSKA